MTKEEMIKKEWGALSPEVDENGWLYFGHSCNGWDDVEDWLKQNNVNSEEKHYDAISHECDNGDLLNIRIRPKSLQGIEDNNGWISIEPNGIECGGEIELYNIKTKEHYFSIDENEFIKKGRFTHYKPIVKSKPPIY